MFYFCGVGIFSLAVERLAGVLPQGWGAARGVGGSGIVTHRLTLSRVE